MPRTRPSFLKRQKEQQRKAKAEQKRDARRARKRGATLADNETGPEADLTPPVGENPTEV